MDIPTAKELQNFTKENPSKWDPLESFCQITTQCDQSFVEQQVALNSVYSAISDYTDIQKTSSVYKM